MTKQHKSPARRQQVGMLQVEMKAFMRRMKSANQTGAQ